MTARSTEDPLGEFRGAINAGQAIIDACEAAVRSGDYLDIGALYRIPGATQALVMAVVNGYRIITTSKGIRLARLAAQPARVHALRRRGGLQGSAAKLYSQGVADGAASRPPALPDHPEYIAGYRDGTALRK